MNAFTAILQQATKVMSLQERMTAVARKLANANEAHRELTLSASEVETLGILLFLLQKKS
jgi:hypothetical protein